MDHIEIALKKQKWSSIIWEGRNLCIFLTMNLKPVKRLTIFDIFEIKWNKSYILFMVQVCFVCDWWKIMWINQKCIWPMHENSHAFYKETKIRFLVIHEQVYDLMFRVDYWLKLFEFSFLILDNRTKKFKISWSMHH